MDDIEALGLHDALRALAAAGGAMRMDELAEQVGFEDLSITWDRFFEWLLEHERIVVLSGDRVGDAVTLLAGTTLTRRLAAEEANTERVDTAVDLAPLDQLLDRSVPLAAGGRAVVETSIGPLGAPQTHLTGPPGWLGGTAAGELVGFRLADGRLHVESRPDIGDREAAARALAAGASRSLGVSAEYMQDPDQHLTKVLWEALAGDPADAGAEPEPALRTVLPALTELVDLAGLRRVDEVIFGAGVELPDSDPRELGMAMSAVLHGLDGEEAEALQDLREARAAVLDGGVPDARAAAAALADPTVTFVFVHESGADAAAQAVAEAAAAEEEGAEEAGAGARFILAHAAERRGDHHEAERLIGLVLDGVPDHPYALADAGWFAEDRGDARRALALLQRSTAVDPGELDHLRAVLAAKSADVGRNAPCPCGSGRKFKVCCARRDGGPLPQRAEWLVWKLAAFARRAPQRRRLRPLVEARELDDDTHGPVTDPLVLDLGVFDCGLLEEFLDLRGHLLPDDERDLAASWIDTERALYRLARQRGETLELVEVVTGQGHAVHAPGAVPLPRDTVLLGRIVPSGGDQPMLFWVPLVLNTDIELQPAFVEALRTSQPLTLAAALPEDRPWVRTTEGELTVLCERRYALPTSADRARAALRDTDLDEDELSGAFHDLAEVAGALRVRGSVTITDAELHVHTSAEPRMERLAGLVEEAVEGLDLLVEHRTPLWRAVDDMACYGVLDDRDVLLGDPLAGLTAVSDDAGWRSAAPAGGEDARRRAFVAPPAEGTFDGIDLALLDPAVAEERFILIAAEHPDLDGGPIGDLADATEEPPSPELHLAMHGLVADQLWEDEPPQVWETAQRLLEAGYDRHEVLHMLAFVASGETWRMMERQEVFDLDRYVAALDALPGSWEAERADAPGPRRGRRLPPGAAHPGR